MELPPLISRKVFFANPDKADVELSPDGSQIAYLAPLEGVQNVWVAARDRLADARPVTHDTHRGIRIYFWAYTNRHILYFQDKNGDENWRMHAVDLATNEDKDLTPIEGVQAQPLAVSPKFPDQVVVGLNFRDPQWHDVYRVNIITGDRTLLLQHDRFAVIYVDDDYHMRIALSMTADGGMEVFLPSQAGDWQSYEVIPAEDTLTTHYRNFDKTGQTVFLKDSRGRNTSALFALDLGTGRRTLLAEDPKADAEGVMSHPTEKHAQAVSFTYQRKRWQILDPSIEPDLAYLRGLADGDVEVVSRTLDDRYWITLHVMDNGPVRFHLYDRANRQATFLFTSRKQLEGKSLAKMWPVVIPSRDGLDLVSYYSLPVGSDSNGDGIPDRPLPMVLTPHGGPWYRDYWGYNAWHQWLANRGYAVLGVNFRASTGFGKEFINAGNLQWGKKVHEDQIDAVRWAAAAGIADPDKIAVMGGSFGGYSALAGLTFSPEVFACGVDLVGPSNLMTLLESMPPYWKPMLELFTTRVGDHRTEDGRALLREHSPLTYADRICRPLLIGQGANDPRVKQAESDQIVQAMQAKGIPVTYVLYPDEGHGFARPENNLSFNAIAESFLAKCLGGRAEPIGEDFKDSSLQVLAGAEQVPGLKEAIPAGACKAKGDGPQ
jgi:dipeptidyl aminopeptidase/acylaminoacyl peptidase